MTQLPKAMVTIDPGADGAAVIWEGREPVSWTFFKHGKRDDYAVMLYDFLRHYGIDSMEVAFVERIFKPYKGTINEGVKLGCLQILGIPVVRVASSTWQAHRNKSVDKGWRALPWKYRTTGKKKSVYLAMKRFPGAKLLRTSQCTTPHDGLAEALCMGLWAVDGFEKGKIEIPRIEFDRWGALDE